MPYSRVDKMKAAIAASVYYKYRVKITWEHAIIDSLLAGPGSWAGLDCRASRNEMLRLAKLFLWCHEEGIVVCTDNLFCRVRNRILRRFTPH